MSAPQILYRLTWTAADGSQHTVLGVHAAVSALEPVLVDAGATAIVIDVPERRQGRHAKPRLDEPLWGAEAERVRDDLDSGDRTAMSRLARRAFRPEGSE